MSSNYTKISGHCLLNHKAIDQYVAVVASLADQENASLMRQLLTAAEATAPVMESALEEARAVLNGRTDAGERLWLLLRNIAISPAMPILPDDLLRKSYGAKRTDAPDAPYLIDRDGLHDLIGGTVWAARNDAEETAMMNALRQLLDPLLQLEYAWNAARLLSAGKPDVFKTLKFYFSELLLAVHKIGGPQPDPAGGIWKNRADEKGPGINPHPSPLISEWTNIWGCMGQGRKAMSVIDHFAAPYNITGISNPSACGGQQILITGTNFGPRGRVYFPIPDPSDPVFTEHHTEIRLDGVDPIAWDDSAVTVVVPVWAVSGMIHLNAFQRISDPCWIKDIFHLGNEFEFTGGLASIYEVYVNLSATGTGLNGEFVIVPNDVFLLGYRATARADVQVRVEIVADGTTLFLRNGLVGGINTFPVQLSTDPGMPKKGEMILTASSNCGGTQPLRVPVVIAVVPVLTIDYIEVTQGVQVSLPDVLAGKAVPLVSNKDSAVRVYLRCDRGGWFQNTLDKISGAVRMSTPSGNFLIPPSNTRPVVPDKGLIEVSGQSHDYDDFTTLNFLLPAGWCTPGVHTLAVTVRCADMTGMISLSQTITWTWIEKSVVRTRWLFLNPENGDEFGLFTLADQFLRDALLYLPTPVWDTGPAWKNSYYHDYDLNQREEWSELLDDLEGFKNCTIWDDINPFADHCESIDDGAHWVAIIRPGVDISGSKALGLSHTPGMVSIAVMTDFVAAHELGHQLGLNHVNLVDAKSKISIAGPFDTVENGGYLSRAAFNVQLQKAIMRAPGIADNFGRVNPMPADLMSYFDPLFLTVTHWNQIFDSL